MSLPGDWRRALNEQERPIHDLAGDRALAITEGEWAGWSTWTSHPFQQSAGPFFQRLDEDGNALTAFGRAGGTVVFLQGIVTGDGEPALSFTGIVKKTRER